MLCLHDVDVQVCSYLFCTTQWLESMLLMPITVGTVIEACNSMFFIPSTICVPPFETSHDNTATSPPALSTYQINLQNMLGTVMLDVTCQHRLPLQWTEMIAGIDAQHPTPLPILASPLNSSSRLLQIVIIFSFSICVNIFTTSRGFLGLLFVILLEIWLLPLRNPIVSVVQLTDTVSHKSHLCSLTTEISYSNVLILSIWTERSWIWTIFKSNVEWIHIFWRVSSIWCLLMSVSASMPSARSLQCWYSIALLFSRV